MKWLLLTTALISTPAMAQECIDTELVMLSDLSGSMNLAEKKIVRDGHVAAFRDGSVLDKIQEGPCGAVLVTYVEWAMHQKVVVDWTVISSDEDAEAFATALENAPFSNVGASTMLSYAMDFAGKIIKGNGIDATDRVVDILGDGQDDSSTKPSEIVERYSGKGVPIWEKITWNAIPVVERNGNSSGKDLIHYFQTQVVGGPWSRVVPAYGFEDVPRAIVEKLSKEIS